MQTLFLDTQNHIYITEKCDPVENNSFNKYIQSNEITLIISLYTLVEFARSQSIEQAIKLADIFTKVNTLCSLDFYEIQINELYKFILKHFYNFLAEPVSTFLPINNIYGGAFKNPEDAILAARAQMQGFERTFQRSANALDQLTKNEKLSAAQQNEALFNNIIRKIEHIEQSGRFFPVTNKRAIASDIILKRKKQFLRENICAATEIYLSNYRASNKNRNAKSSDAIDLVTSVAVFPYVDIFISNDGFLKNGLEYVKKQTLLNTKIHRKVSDIKF